MSLDLFTKHNHPWIFGTSVFCLKKVNSSGVPRLWVLFTKTLQYQHIQHAKPSWNSSNAMLDDWKPPKMSCFNLWLVSATTFQASPSCRHPPTPEGRCCFSFWFLADSSHRHRRLSITNSKTSDSGGPTLRRSMAPHGSTSLQDLHIQNTPGPPPRIMDLFREKPVSKILLACLNESAKVENVRWHMRIWGIPQEMPSKFCWVAPLEKIHDGGTLHQNLDIWLRISWWPWHLHELWTSPTWLCATCQG